MSKRTLSLLLCFVMVLSVMAVVPVKAVTYLQTQLKVIPDKTTVNSGDVINYTVIMGPVSDMGSMQMVLDIPEGLTYVPESGRLADDLVTTLGFDVADWTEVSLMINGGASAADYTSNSNTVLGYFQCKVDDNFVGTAVVGLTELEFYSCQTWEEHTERFNVVATEVTVGTPQETVPEIANEIWFAGAVVNAEKPYIIQPMKTDWPDQANADACIASSSQTLGPNQKVLAKFDAATGTLTFLSGYRLESMDGMTEPEGGWGTHTQIQPKADTKTKYGILANGDLTIDLNGYINGFYIDWTGGIKDTNIRGIEVNGDLTIKDSVGTGYFRIVANSANNTVSGSTEVYTTYGLKATGDVNLEGGQLYIYERLHDSTVNPEVGATFIHADGNINLTGAGLKFRAWKEACDGDADDWVITHFNKTPIYDENAYKVAYQPTLDVYNILGYTMESTTNNINNMTYTPIKQLKNATEVVYSGQILNSEKPYLFIDYNDFAGGFGGSYRRVTSSASPSAGSDKILLAVFDAETATLTYKYGFEKITKSGSPYSEVDTGRVVPVYDESDAKYYGIKANGSLTIDLGTYNNAIKFNWNDLGSNMNVIDVAGHLTIKGNGGHLGIHAAPGTDAANDSDPHKYSGAHHTNGIRTDGDVTIEGGEVYIYARPYTTSADETTTFVNAGGSIVLSGGKLRLRGFRAMQTKAVLTNSTPVLDGSYITENNTNESLDAGDGIGLGFVYPEEGDGNLWNKTYIPKYTVSFEENGAGTAINDLTVAYGEKIDFSEYIPRKVNATFAGWYSDAELTNKVTNMEIYADTTVYAKWEPSTADYYITLNGGETVQTGTNVVEIKFSKTPPTTNESVVIIVSVYEKSTVGGKKVERLKECKSVTKQISELTQPVQINVDANAQDAVDVFIWKDGKTLKVVQEQFTFGR